VPIDSSNQPARDWGSNWLSLPMIAGGSDLGLYVGGRVSKVGYGFRKYPWSYKHTMSAGFATARTGFEAEYDGQFYRNNSRTHYQLVVRGSQIDVLRFYGLGNETSDAPGEDFFRVEQDLVSIAPSVHFGAGALDWEVGLLAQSTSTDTPLDSFIGQARPYGAGTFGEAALRTRLTIGQRDLGKLASAYIWADGAYFPEVWDVESAFGRMEGQAAVFVSPANVILSPQFGFRVGAKKVFGTFPFHESAFLGGPDQVRGLRRERYAGDASAFGSAEVHLRLANVFLLLPSEFGIMGFGDIGRVWVDGEDSSKWHKGWGGGLWLAPLKRSATLAVVMARSEGLTRYYVQAGFGF
jgi:hypothetical protein